MTLLLLAIYLILALLPNDNGWWKTHRVRTLVPMALILCITVGLDYIASIHVGNMDLETYDVFLSGTLEGYILANISLIMSTLGAGVLFIVGGYLTLTGGYSILKRADEEIMEAEQPMQLKDIEDCTASTTITSSLPPMRPLPTPRKRR